MEFNAKRIDEANVEISAVLKKASIDTQADKIAKEAAKTMSVQGFRKGKVPVHVAKARYGEQLTQDAETELLREILKNALDELKVANEDIVGEPAFTKYDKNDDGDIDLEMKVSTRPLIELGDYKALVPEIKAIETSDEEITKRLQEMASQGAPLVKIKRKRMAKDKDYALIDFEGFVDGVAFDGGKGEKYPLHIGSGSFIPGFEEQIIGMKYEEQKDVTVTFPEEYQAKDLAGKEAVFKVTLHEIQEKGEALIDDEFAQKMLPNEKDVTVETLKAKMKEQLENEAKGKYYREEVKPAYFEKLISELKFALPNSVVDQEINMALNDKVKNMSEEELKALQEDAKKVEEMREEIRPEAQDAVKATFIVDALAKAEGVTVSDQEVQQVIYYEAMQMRQNPQDVLKQYQDAGYMPAVKMSMTEDKVLTKLFNEKLGK